MCQATVYLIQESQECEVMRDVILLERTENGVRLHTFFEEPKMLPAQVQQVDFLKHTVTLVALEKHGG
ncbi:MAG: CooT family nickel-binding protein [Chloroflexi bacterium]|nr:CooT family nickel-binding protein [Chloroflexota bacterium]